MTKLYPIAVIVTLLFGLDSFTSAKELVSIAHRGASGYLPEHTREATAMAYGMGADFIEQDLVLSRDSVPVVLHDIHIDTVTNVAELYPTRHRDDGRYYAIDFDWEELKQLRVNERIDVRRRTAVYPGRFPTDGEGFRIASFREMIELIQGMNKSTGRQVGLYPELKAPAWHRENGVEMTPVILTLLREFGYTTEMDDVYVQCFEADELRRMRKEHQCRLRLVQLIANDDQWTAAGLADIAEYANGVGPSIDRVLVPTEDEQPGYRVHSAVGEARRLKLVVHPYTVRHDALPRYARSAHELRRFLQEAGVDGFFTDSLDLGRQQRP